MDSMPITGLEELESHLQQLLENPDAPLIPKLFDDVELQLSGTYLGLVALSVFLK